MGLGVGGRAGNQGRWWQKPLAWPALMGAVTHSASSSPQILRRPWYTLRVEKGTWGDETSLRRGSLQGREHQQLPLRGHLHRSLWICLMGS